MVNIVVIGDSIAKGVGSTDASAKSFAALIGEKVNGTVNNLGITGLDSGQLMEKLKTEKFQTALEDADVIFVSIGSNDLLKPFLSIVANAAGVSGEGKDLYEKLQKQFAKLSKEDPLAAGNALAVAVKNVNNNKQLAQACKQFPEHFETIIKQIKSINPEALIYVNNIYNPYYGVAYEYDGLTLLNVHKLCESYIVKLNQAFDPSSGEYTLMDMYSVFRQTGLTNVNAASLENMSRVNFDPHPNDAGYQLMADYIYTRMDSIPPKVELVLEESAEEPAGAQNQMRISSESITLRFSEQVRTVEGKKIIIHDPKKEYIYRLTGKETVEKETVKKEAEEKGTVQQQEGYVLKIPLDAFDETLYLDYNTTYRVSLEEGAVKDKGNNSPDNPEAGTFITQSQPEAEIEANSVTVVNEGLPGKDEMAGKIILSSVLLFVLIAVAITGWMLYNKKRRKIKETKDYE